MTLRGKLPRYLHRGRVNSLSGLFNAILSRLRGLGLRLGWRRFLRLMANTPSDRMHWSILERRISSAVRRTVLSHLRPSGLIRCLPRPLRQAILAPDKSGLTKLTLLRAIRQFAIETRNFSLVHQSVRKETNLLSALWRKSTRWKKLKAGLARLKFTNDFVWSYFDLILRWELL
jgi:hypothetical protein